MSGYSYAAITEKAPQKRANEDRVFISEKLLDRGRFKGKTDDKIIAIVCDGVGGVSGGDIAAAEAAGSFALFDTCRLTFSALDRHILQINNTIRDMQKADRAHSSMATTVAGLIISKSNYVAFNLGDSRVYRYSDKTLTMLTRDHTVAQAKLNRGEIFDIKDAPAADRNTLTRYIGGDDETSVPFTKSGILSKSDEFFLLCSDGISKSLSDEQMSRFLDSNQNIQTTAENLMTAALQHGCTDDRSIILIQVSEGSNGEKSEEKII